MAKDSKVIVVSGKAFWAHVREKNKLSDKYQVDLSIDETTAKELSKLGVNVRNKTSENPQDERGDFVTLKSDFPPKIVDSKKREVPKDVLVGNGSKVKVVGNLYDYNFKGKKGIGFGLKGLQILDLVEYKAADLFDEESGFEVEDKDDLDLPL